MKWFLASCLVVLALLLPATASADDGREGEGLILRVTGDITVAKDQTVGSLVVIDGNATVDGTVKDSLTVISGTAVVNGLVGKDVIVVSGTLDLRTGSEVRDIHLIKSNLLRADGVSVTGKITDRDGFEVPSGFMAALSIYFWVALTVAAIVAGVVFAAVGGRQLNEAAHAMTEEPANSFVGAVCLWIGVPLLAVLAMLTVIGIPLGLGILLIVLPALWFLGYIVAGARLGQLILSRNEGNGRPIAATTLGIVLLQVGVLLPVAGALVAFVAGTWGAGALAFTAYRAAGGKGFGRAAPTQPSSNPSLAT